MRIPGLIAHARHYRPVLVLRDLDREGCVADLVGRLTGRTQAGSQPPDRFLLRIAVRAVEAWLMADHEAFAGHFALRAGAMPVDPDRLPDPARELMALAAKSGSRAMRRDMPPRPGSGARRGELYTSNLLAFVTDTWDPARAAANGRSPSLTRAFDRLRAIAGT